MVFELFGMIFGADLVLVVQITLIIIGSAVIAHLIDFLLLRYFRKTSRALKIDETQFVILRRLALVGIYLAGIIIAGSLIPGFSGLGVSLLASAGILAVVVGLAAQQTLSNVIAGVSIAVSQPFRVGDKLTIKDDYGEVEDITLRHTVINTWDNKRIIIPNSKISEEYITNYSIKDPKILGTLNIGISYDSNIDKARKIMLDEAKKNDNVMKVVKGKDSEFLHKDEVILVRLTDLTDFAQNMRLYFWAQDQSTAKKTNYELTEAIKKRFDKEGIEIPFPYHTIVYKKDLEKQAGK
ncbi:MAG: mechanosensitive ion channel family protein [Candidatus Diapherotrites archaeon]